MGYKPKSCVYCGKIFIPTSSKQKYCKDIHYGNCPVCGKQVIIKDLHYGPRACSMECRQKEIEATSVEKYGTKNPNQSEVVKEKSRKTCLEKYGSETPFGSKEVQEKINKTNLERYGTIHPSSTNEVKEKCQKTFQEKYGGNSPMSSEEVREKIRKSVNEKYGVDNVFQNEDIKKKIKQINLEKYGVENPMQNSEIKQKVKNTNLQRYGYESISQVPEVQQKIKNSMFERYGVEYALQNDNILRKTYQTNIQRYGTEHPAQNETVKQKAVQTSLEKYGTEYPILNEEIKQKVIDTNIERYGVSHTWKLKETKQKISQTNQEKYGVPWACMREEARCHNAISSWNLKFAKMLEDNNINYELEYRINNYSYDIRVDDTLIEIDSTAFHNSYMDIYDKDSNGKTSDYHLNKSNVAKENGFRCIHVFDWDDWKKILALLLPKEKIYARKCKIEEVSKSDCNKFLNQYHLQGTCNGQTYRYGLFYDDNLVEIMTFGKPRYNKNYEYELLRLCTDSKYQVIGGASKLFKHFLNKINPSSIISYCDYSKFNGEVYEEIGMKFSHLNTPSKIWSKGNLKITNNLLCQRGYDQLFNTDYGKGTSNEELMLEHGWFPVYDCGQSVFIYNIPI